MQNIQYKGEYFHDNGKKEIFWMKLIFKTKEQ